MTAAGSVTASIGNNSNAVLKIASVDDVRANAVHQEVTTIDSITAAIGNNSNATSKIGALSGLNHTGAKVSRI